MANEQAVDDHLSVGVRLPNGQIQKPMSGQHLYWTKPGKIRKLRKSASGKYGRGKSGGETPDFHPRSFFCFTLDGLKKRGAAGNLASRCGKS